MICIPIKIESTANLREHWSKRAKRAKEHRESAWLALRASDVTRGLPEAVHLTRIAPRALDDDNLANGFKALRDGIADYFKINDNDPRVQWRYAQRKGKPKEYAVEVLLTSCGA